MTTKDKAATQGRLPPYIAFKTFLTAIETLQHALPPVLDRSVWHTFSGSLQSHTLGAFKYLELIDDDKRLIKSIISIYKNFGIDLEYNKTISRIKTFWKFWGIKRDFKVA